MYTKSSSTYDFKTIERILKYYSYCHIWILGYRELARPLYKLITETQQAQTKKLGQRLKRLLKLFKLLSCRLPL